MKAIHWSRHFTLETSSSLKLYKYRVEISLQGSICIKMLIPPMKFKISYCQDECCIPVYPIIIFLPRWTWITMMVLLTQRNTYKTYRATWNLFSKIAIICFGDLCFKVVTQFNTSIPAKRSFTKLFGVTHVDDESTRAYLKRFNEKMLKVKELIELIALETLISGVKRKVVPACLVDQVNFNAIILLCFSALPLSPQLNVSWISTLLKPLRSSKAKGFRV